MMNRRDFLKGLVTAAAAAIAGKAVIGEGIPTEAVCKPITEDTYTKAQVAMNKLIAGLVRRRMEDMSHRCPPGVKYVEVSSMLQKIPLPDPDQLKERIAEKAKMMQDAFERAIWENKPYVINRYDADSSGEWDYPDGEDDDA